jgi:hypothetical protein
MPYGDDNDNLNGRSRPSPGMPDQFDRIMGALDGLPDVEHTRPATIRVVPPLGIGGAQLWVVQTFRQKDQGDVIFLETVAGSIATRLPIPAKVADLIARQRDQLSGQMRSKAAKASAQARKDRGELPAFMKRKPAKRKKKAKAGTEKQK